MKKYIAIVLLMTGIVSCKKDTLTKKDTYSTIFYTIQTADSNLQVNLMRAVYTETTKGNIGKDTVLVNPGTYQIEAVVFNNVPVTLFAMSEISPDFHLKIESLSGTTFAETDTVTIYPANQLHPVQYVSKLTATL